MYHILVRIIYGWWINLDKNLHFSGANLLSSLVPSPLHARARKGLVKRAALPCPSGMQ